MRRGTARALWATALSAAVGGDPGEDERGAWLFGRRPIGAIGEPCFLVLTYKKVHGTRCAEQRETWGSDAHIAGWASDEEDPDLPGSFAAYPSEGRKYLGSKALAAFEWVMRHE
eukprot:gene45235-18769_t